MNTTTRAPKNKTIAIVLALFLGGLGAHKFYLERPGIAMCYFFLCWTLIPSIVGLFEAVMYMTMNQKNWEKYSSK